MSVIPRAFALTLLSLPAFAGQYDSDLSDADTSYTGATMLIGNETVSLEGVAVSEFSDTADQVTYGYFSGNTLYAGTEDLAGNRVDAIVEFFWFESSIDRGSDFYVAVIKARTSPSDDYGLDFCTLWSDCEGPALAVYTDTDTSGGNGAFRWDWSLPFADYGIDAIGSVSLTNSYGIGGSAEGSAMTSETYDEDGNKLEGTVQSKGHVSTEYKVETQYQVNLYEWDVEVAGAASMMDWELYLNSGMAEEDNAYHEFFLVMQVDEGAPFTISNVDITGTIDKGMWNRANTLGVGLTGITLVRPDYTAPDDGYDDDWDDSWDTGTDNPFDDDVQDDELDDWSDEQDLADESADDSTTDIADVEESTSSGPRLFGCATAPMGGVGAWALLALVGLARRRD
jgi:uncharacterized protein (TIGR03382 family)